MLTAVVLEGGLALVAAVVGWLCGFDPWYGLHRPSYNFESFSRDVLWGIVATTPAVAVLLLEDNWLLPLNQLKEQVVELLQRLMHGARLWQLFVISLAAGIGEEVLFRGLIQAGLMELLHRCCTRRQFA